MKMVMFTGISVIHRTELYEVEDGRIVEAHIVDTEDRTRCLGILLTSSRRPYGHYSRGIGDGARQALAKASIQLYGGVPEVPMSRKGSWYGEPGIRPQSILRPPRPRRRSP